MPPPNSKTTVPGSLRPGDQLATAVIVGMVIVVLGGHWWWQGRFRGELIEIDRAQPEQVQFSVDVNAAEWEELTLLPEIGEQLARRIVENRDDIGPFGDINDLRRVRGIGPKTLDRIRPYLIPIPDRGNVAGSGAEQQRG